MKSAPIIGFYGLSNTGKTTLITSIIDFFSKKNLNIATIKQTTHSYSIDSSGKDTRRYTKVGSNLVCFQTAIETSFILNKKIPVNKMIEILHSIDSFDLVFVEGARDKNIEKIRVGEKTPLRENTIFTYENDINRVLSFIEQQLERKEKK